MLLLIGYNIDIFEHLTTLSRVTFTIHDSHSNLTIVLSVYSHFMMSSFQTLDGFELWFSKQGGITYVQTMEKGDQGVTSFFVLSGFLIPFILTRQVKSRKERYLTFWSAIDFLFHRWIRLAPTLYVATVISLIYGYYTTSTFAKVEFYDGCKNYWWTNILFLNDFSGGLTGTVGPPVLQPYIYTLSSMRYKPTSFEVCFTWLDGLSVSKRHDF